MIYVAVATGKPSATMRNLPSAASTGTESAVADRNAKRCNEDPTECRLNGHGECSAHKA